MYENWYARKEKQPIRTMFASLQIDFIFVLR